jgi:SAM-dependent methyltransferase
MRPDALNLFACPLCGETLSLSRQGVREDDGHIISGELACTSCSGRFPIRQGVPVLLRTDTETVKKETASRFAEEWLRWSDLRDYYKEEFFAWVAPLRPADFEDKLVFEGGCGKGRHTAIAASCGARAVVSIDLGDSAFVAFRHTRNLPNVHVAIGDLLRPPVKPIFDLAFSVGVLHHLPDPAAGFRSLASRVRDDGQVCFWVYGQEGNEWITRYVNPIRVSVTSKLPAGLLRALCWPPSVLLWSVIKLLYRPRPHGKGPAFLPYGDYFASMHSYPFDEIHANVFDQMVTPVAYYLRGEEVRSWVAVGFENAILRSHRGYSWTGLATVKQEDSRPVEMIASGSACRA